MEKKDVVTVMLRLSVGFLFCWAFLDKLIGLGYATCRVKATGEYLGPLCGKAWLMGGSPTKVYLSDVTGPFSWLFNPMAGHPVVNTLFMLGLLGVGVAFLAGAVLRPGAWVGSALLAGMWLAERGTYLTNPFMNEHVIYAMVLFLLYYLDAGAHAGFGARWRATGLVKKYPWLA